MRPVSHRARRIVRGAAIPAALLASAIVVWQASYSAFSSTTTSPGNQWSTGSLALTNDTTGTFQTTGTLMFNPGSVMPGDTGTWCVNVKNGGTVPASATNPIKFYASLPATLSTNALAQQLDLSVVESSTTGVTGGATGDCTNFTAGTTVYSGLLSALPQTFAAAPTADSSLGAGATTAFQITWTLPSTATNAAQGQSLTGVEFDWSMQVGN